jgi:hypothetical protein
MAETPWRLGLREPRSFVEGRADCDEVAMIKDRPAHLLAQPDYKALPQKAFGVHFDALPDFVRKSFGPLGGIQPVTGAMFKAAQGKLHDLPSPGEIELFRKAEMRFRGR